MLLKDLKKSRDAQKQKLHEELDKLKNKSTRTVDERFWQPTVDKIGNAVATIRFLPAPDGEEVPWVQLFTHNFEGPTGKWFINNCPTTINQKCPLCEANSILWNNPVNEEDNKRIVRQRKRKLSYISNIYVISDQANQDNDGKVFLYKFGVKIFDKINGLMFPEFEDEEAVNPFDFWEGANFKLKVRKVDGYTNYDKSVFASTSPLFENDEEIDEIWKQEHQLAEFVAEKNFKSYDTLKNGLAFVLGGAVTETPTETTHETPVTKAVAKVSVVEVETDKEEDAPVKPDDKKTPASAEEDSVEDDDDADVMSYLKKLSEDD